MINIVLPENEGVVSDTTTSEAILPNPSDYLPDISLEEYLGLTEWEQKFIKGNYDYFTTLRSIYKAGIAFQIPTRDLHQAIREARDKFHEYCGIIPTKID